MQLKGINEGFQDTDLKQGIVSGYFAIFGNKDLDGDIIEQGAFTKTIQERGPMGKKLIKFLIDHDKTKVPGVITELYEDQKGLKYSMKAGSHFLGQDFIKMVDSGILNQHSFGFKTIKEQFDQQAKANRIKEVMMFEGSAVQFLGANPETTYIESKTPQELMFEISRFEEVIEKLHRFAMTSDASDETLILVEKHINILINDKLKSLLIKLKPEDSTSKDKKADQVPIELKLSFEKWKI